MLIAGGVLAAQHYLARLPVLTIAWGAATAGGIVGWVIGRRAGRAVIDVVDDVGAVTSGILAVVIVAAVVFKIRRRRLRQA